MEEARHNATDDSSSSTLPDGNIHRALESLRRDRSKEDEPPPSKKAKSNPTAGEVDADHDGDGFPQDRLYHHPSVWESNGRCVRQNPPPGYVPASTYKSSTTPESPALPEYDSGTPLPSPCDLRTPPPSPPPSPKDVEDTPSES